MHCFDSPKSGKHGGFVARPETVQDGSLNLMVWNCTIPGKAGVFDQRTMRLVQVTIDEKIILSFQLLLSVKVAVAYGQAKKFVRFMMRLRSLLIRLMLRWLWLMVEL